MLNREELEAAFRRARELDSKPIARQIKAGRTAWPKVKERLGVKSPDVALAGALLGLSGITVHVLEPNVWPPNLVAVLDQEGNAMTAWIIND